VKINVIKNILDRQLKYTHENSAAVLVPLLKPDETVTKLLMIQRSMNLKRNAGQIAFPGGLREGKESPDETALREFEEELGVNRSEVKVLGYLRPEIIEEHGIYVYPVVGLLKLSDDYEFVPNFEVRKILVDELVKILTTRRIEERGVIFEFGGHIVWGASSRILDDMYNRLQSILEKPLSEYNARGKI